MGMIVSPNTFVLGEMHISEKQTSHMMI